MKRTEINFELQQIHAAAERFLHEAKDAKVFTFSGELGAGKTTFIARVCSLLGVKDVVNSPTFSIVQQYNSPAGNVFHIDLYRIKNEQEAVDAGLADCIDSGDLCFIEWPENAPGIIPGNAVTTQIHITGEENRRLEIHIPDPSM